MPSFSDRNNFTRRPVAITVREGAPQQLREAVMELAIKSGGSLPSIAAYIADKFPLTYAAYNIPIYHQAAEGLKQAEWFKVYDLAEELWLLLRGVNKPAAMKYEAHLNEYFYAHGVGWKMEGGKILARDNDSVEPAVVDASRALADCGLTTSARELEEARTDISRRPTPDITGAIQHLAAALECTMREASGDPKATFGELLKKYPNVFPPAIGSALEKVWGYASEMGRHVREGREPDVKEAFLALEMGSAAINYILARMERQPTPPLARND